MNIKKTSQRYSEIISFGKDVLLWRYPGFIYGGSLSAKQLPPVFCFHSAEPVSFEATLQFLKTNDYCTISVDEFHYLLSQRKAALAARAILLTFDDGLSSVWSVAYPLLKKYGFMATVFLIPSRVRNLPESRYYPNLEDVWAGRATLEEITNRDNGDEPFASWEEIRIMHESGVIDFQSHTLDHSSIFISSTIEDFIGNASFSRSRLFKYAMFIRRDLNQAEYNMPELGTPVYTSAPRMSRYHRYLGDAGLEKACTAFVKAKGGGAFFKREGWKKELMRLVEDYKKRNPLPEGFETLEERRAEILFDLKTSKALIEQNLPGKEVCHLAYPWGKGSGLSISLSKMAGYQTNFWGKVDRRLTNTPDQDPFRIARMGEDFLYLLPGAGRASLKKVITKKLNRRIKRNPA